MDTEPKRIERDTISQLIYLRDKSSDEIPAEMLTSASPNNRYMVRKAWWQGVIAALDNALTENLIPNKHRGEVENFIENEIDRLGKEAKTNPRKRTTEQDLNRAKNILDKVLGRKP